MKSTKTKIKYAKKDALTENDFEGGKFRVTMFIDLDVLGEIRNRAEKRGLGYQTYINQLLRDVVLGEDEKRIRRIVQDELSKKVG